MSRGTTQVVTRGTTNLINAESAKGRFGKSCYEVWRLARVPEPTNCSFHKVTWQQASGGSRMLQLVSYEVAGSESRAMISQSLAFNEAARRVNY
ncbi:hypothetical protein Tco_1336611 [Tanacetum coccineum]